MSNATLIGTGRFRSCHRDLGISAVPFYVLDRRYGVSGAQPPDNLLAALRQAWDEAPRAAA